MHTQLSKKLPWIILPFALGYANFSFAQDAPQCASDADCDEGSACEKGRYVNGCNPDAGECDTTVHEEETGTCVVQPVQCSSDADCGEYLACQASETGACWASSDGQSGCTEPDPDAAKYCAPKSFECEVDSDCPREFECVDQVVCPDIACITEPCEAQCSTEGRQCQPKQIECDDDSACPSDWSCLGTVQYECTGGGSSSGGSTLDDPTETTPEGGEVDAPDSDPAGNETPASDEPPPDEATLEERSCTEVKSQGYCQPDAWGYSYAVDLGEVAQDEGSSNAGTGDPDQAEPPRGDDGASDADAESEEAAGEDEGAGCSVTTHAPTRTGAWGWMLLLALPLLRRRASSKQA